MIWVKLVILTALNFVAAQKYYGTHINRLSELHHGVSGDVFAVDSRTLFIKGFTYDGEGPAAYFYVGTSKTPSAKGSFRIRDERGNSGVLKRYRNKDITLTLPEGKSLRDVAWFSVWCDEFSVDFGNVVIPKNLEYPRPQKVSGLKGIHAVQSDNIVIVDAQTLLIPNFSYDGVAPDAKFWAGRGQKPSPNGIRIFDENGKETPLKRYDRKTIVLTLPGELTVFDIGHFGVWCEAFAVDFAHVRIPEKLNVPPSLKMLGISPQSKLNCEVLHDDLAFEVRWAVAGESVVIQLVAKLDDNEYMSFGVSGNTEKNAMIGGDVVVAWVNRLTGKGYAQDYFLEAKSQCSGNHGSCPDTRLKDNTNSIRLLNAAIVNDYSIVTYQRPLKPVDAYDKQILLNGTQAIIWAIGPLNQRFEVSYHTEFLKKNKLIDFGRQPFWNCPIPENEHKSIVSDLTENNSDKHPQAQKVNRPITQNRPAQTPRPVAKRDAWDIPPIQCNEPEDGVFYAQIGPTGGTHGYPAITGHVGWGISWYINGLLIPEINVVRNKTYTFVVEGGNDPDVPAKYHPFYISDDSVGGYEHKTADERKKVEVYAGIHKSRNGKVTPTGVGRICNWTPDINGPTADEHPSFGSYQRSLTLKCDEGEPGIITWTPDHDTPDTVYYQCFTHRYLGWKINVLDSCDSSAQASYRDDVYVDAQAEPSIQHESKVLPSENFLQHHEKDLIKHHNMNGGHSKNIEDLQKQSDFNKFITDGINAAEYLEKSLMREQKSNATKVNSPSILESGAQEDDKELLDAIAKIPQGNQKPLYRPPHVNLGHKVVHSGRPKHPENLGPYRIPGPKRQPVSPAGIPFFLRAPTNVNYPFHQGKPVHRRPISGERRPPGPLPHRMPVNPYLLPQQSIMINHYKKPSFGPPPFGVRNYMKSKTPPVRLNPINPVMMLGEPTEIKTSSKKNSDLIIGRPSKTQVEVLPAFLNKKAHEPLRPNKHAPKKSEKYAVRSSFKDPFDIKLNPVPLREAANTGFKADTIIVESGFQPIRREDDFKTEDSFEDEPALTISRRSDTFDEDSEFEDYEEPRNAFFEPMFIPSPLDSMALPLVNNSESKIDSMAADASERQDIFYLPPNESKRAAVNYDAKAILDTSLLNDPLPSENDYVKLSSKIKQFIKDTPQFGPFKGEIPSDLMLQLSASRDNSPVVTKVKPSLLSTKLSAVKTNVGTR